MLKLWRWIVDWFRRDVERSKTNENFLGADIEQSEWKP